MSNRDKQLEQKLRNKRRGYPAAAAPMGLNTLEDIRHQVQIIQEQLDIAFGRRGSVQDQLLAVRDLEDPAVTGLFDLGGGSGEDGAGIIQYGIPNMGVGVDEYTHLNNYDFTGEQFAQGTSLYIAVNHVVLFGINNVAYSYLGPKDVTVGLGGSHTVVNGELSGVGTTDHTLLANREDALQHPQGAITDLVQDQADQNAEITANTSKNTTQDDRLDQIDIDQGVQNGSITANTNKNTEQDNRLGQIDTDQTTQDGRLTDLEAWDANHEIALNPHGKLQWVGPWVPRPSLVDDVTVDGNWLGFCIEDNTESPAPQEVGNSAYDLEADPGFVTQLFTGVAQSGAQYVLTEPGWINRLEVQVAEAGPDISNRVLVINTTDPDNPTARVFADAVTDVDGWAVVIVDPTPFPEGTSFRVLLETLNSATNTTVTGDWDRSGNSNSVGTDPGSGGWGTRNNENSLRISKTDADGADRSANLLQMGAGTEVTFADKLAPNESMSWVLNSAPADQGGHYSWNDVTYVGAGVFGEPDVGAECTMTAQVPVAAQTQYRAATGYWPTHQPSWTTVQGLLLLDGVDQNADDDAFGVRIEFQPAYISPYWDIVRVGGGSSAGSGSEPVAVEWGAIGGDINTQLDLAAELDESPRVIASVDIAGRDISKGANPVVVQIDNDHDHEIILSHFECNPSETSEQSVGMRIHNASGVLGSDGYQFAFMRASASGVDSGGTASPHAGSWALMTATWRNNGTSGVAYSGKGFIGTSRKACARMTYHFTGNSYDTVSGEDAVTTIAGNFVNGGQGDITAIEITMRFDLQFPMNTGRVTVLQLPKL